VCVYLGGRVVYLDDPSCVYHGEPFILDNLLDLEYRTLVDHFSMKTVVTQSTLFKKKKNTVNI